MTSQAHYPWYLTQPESELVHKFKDIQRLEKRRIDDGLDHSSTSPWSLGISTDDINSYRNRYSNIMPYERSRVKLPVVRGNDYINASYVNVDVEDQNIATGHYIATQGPTRHTWQQFWQMCYAECPHEDIVIVMVTPLVELGREKCFPYWPQGEEYNDTERDIPRVQSPGGPDDTSVFATELSLKIISSKRYDDNYTLSTLTLEPSDGSAGPVKRVHHFYFDQWQDMSRPEEIVPIMTLSKHAHKLNPRGSPIITHCSAGVGRSGTFIALDHMLHNTRDFAHNSNSSQLTPVSSYQDDLIEQIVMQLRSQRMTMVQLKDQYVFLYHAAMYLYANAEQL